MSHGIFAEVLYEDNHLLCVAKPVNLPVQADESKDADLLTLLKGYIAQKYQKPGAVYLGLVHRLDRPGGRRHGLCPHFKGGKAAQRRAESGGLHQALPGGLPRRAPAPWSFRAGS